MLKSAPDHRYTSKSIQFISSIIMTNTFTACLYVFVGFHTTLLKKVKFYIVARQTPAFLCDAGIWIGRLNKFLNNMNLSRALYRK